MAGFAPAATAAKQNAGQAYAANTTNLMTSTGQARADATTGAANAWNQGIGNLMTTGGYLLGRYGGQGGSTVNRPISAGPY
jgi:hypothetical protein